mmetsp:Transcript_12536/g.16228  ORF Transcript_12536/g.16228 Transcript_12536/m.16228 type:complete len:534 (+) Transcript_12536:297-1898(+)
MSFKFTKKKYSGYNPFRAKAAPKERKGAAGSSPEDSSSSLFSQQGSVADKSYGRSNLEEKQNLDPPAAGKRKLLLNPFERKQMREHIMTILRRARPNAPPAILSKIPALAEKLEYKLYSQAGSATEYSNRFTLPTRLKQMAKDPIPARSGKRQRPIFHNSSGDLQALAKEPRKQFMNSPSTTSVMFLDSAGKEAQQVTFHFTNHVNTKPEVEDSEADDIDDEEEFDESNELDEDATIIKQLHKLLLSLIMEDPSPMKTDAIMKDVIEIYRVHTGLRKKIEAALAHAIIVCKDASSDPGALLLHRMDQKGIDPKAFDIKDVELDNDASMDEPTQTPLTSILKVCAEICGAPNVSDNFIKTLIGLYKGRLVLIDQHVEKVGPEFDVRVLRTCLDRYILTSPDKMPSVVVQILKYWPEKDSVAQGLFLSQLESIVHSSCQSMLIPVLVPVIKRIAKCCVHGNGHLSSHAINIAHKLISLSGLRVQDNVDSKNFRFLKEIREAFVNMKKLILSRSSTYYNPELKSRVAALLQKLSTL